MYLTLFFLILRKAYLGCNNHNRKLEKKEQCNNEQWPTVTESVFMTTIYNQLEFTKKLLLLILIKPFTELSIYTVSSVIKENVATKDH